MLAVQCGLGLLVRRDARFRRFRARQGRRLRGHETPLFLEGA